MGFVVDYITADKKTGRLSFRRAYPADLRPLIPGNPTQLRVSLKSSNLKDPEALKTYARACDEYDKVVATARKQATGPYVPLNSETIRYLAETYLASELDRDDRESSWGGAPRAIPYTPRTDLERDWEESREFLDRRNGKALSDYWTDWALSYAAAMG